MYADDNVLFANNPKKLQENLDILSQYCSRWKLKVNINKTKIMVFRKGGRIPPDFSYNNCQLEIVNNFIYLRMVFTTDGSEGLEWLLKDLT